MLKPSNLKCAVYSKCKQFCLTWLQPLFLISDRFFLVQMSIEREVIKGNKIFFIAATAAFRFSVRPLPVLCMLGNRSEFATSSEDLHERRSWFLNRTFLTSLPRIWNSFRMKWTWSLQMPQAGSIVWAQLHVCMCKAPLAQPLAVIVKRSPGAGRLEKHCPSRLTALD